jgi:hypothetical protein
MSRLSEFKEKTYEKYFGFELARRTKITFSPDQCDEEFLGFDDAFYLPQLHLFPWLPYLRRSRRQRISGISSRDIDIFASQRTRSPLQIQHVFSV